MSDISLPTNSPVDFFNNNSSPFQSNSAITLAQPDNSSNPLAQYLQGLHLASSNELKAPSTGLVPTTYTTPSPAAPIDTSSLGVIQQGLPSAVTSFQTKYAPNNLLQQSLSPSVYNALRNYDQIRLQQGKAPLSGPLTGDVAQAATTGQSVAPAPGPSNIVSAAGQDLKDMLGGIVGIPNSIYNTVKDIPNVPEHIADIQRNANGNLGQILGGYLQLPGVNLIPGTYTASNIAKGDWNQIAQHPLMSALDVLPYANKLAELSPAVKAAETEAANTAALRSETSGVPVASEQVRPLTTALTKTVDESGNVVNNPLGNLTSAASDILTHNPLANPIRQFAQDAWGPDSRLQSRIIFNNQADLTDSLNPEGLHNLSDPAVQWQRETTSLADQYKIPDDRRVAISRAITDPVNNPLDVSTLTPDELAWKDKVTDLTARSKVLNDTLPSTVNPTVERFWHGSDETFTQQEAKRLDAQDKRLSDYQQGVAYRKDAQIQLSQFQDPNNPTIPSDHVNAVIDALQPIKRSDPVAREFVNRFNSGKYQEALSTFRKMKGNKWDEAFGDIDRQGVISNLQAGRDITKNLASYTSYTDRGLASRTARANVARDRITPARFGAIRDEVVKSKLRNMVSSDDFRMQSGIDDPTLQQYLSYIDNGDITSLIGNSEVTPKDYISAVNEAKQTVAQMAEEGIDPVFLHRVSPDRAAQLKYPTILDNKLTPTSTKSRGIDITPYVPDFQIALQHQGLEYLQRRGVEANLEAIDKTFGVDKIDLWNKVEADAQKALARNPNLDVTAFKNNLIAKRLDYVPYDSDSYRPWTKPGSTIGSVSDRYIPGSVARNLKRLHEGPGALTSIVDPVMKVFRTSVLPLSPRWLVNNLFSGLFLMMGETDPLALLKTREAFRMARSGEIENIPGLRGGGAGGVSADEVKSMVSKMTESDRTSAIYRYKGGQFLRRLLESDPATTILGGASKGTQFAYNMNQLADDMFRGMTYLRENDKAINQGLTESEAGAKAVGIARRIMQNFDELTPLERTTLRNVFPFYSFMQHMVRYVSRYPFDHPIRTAIIGSFARNEMKDLGSGLPQDMMSMIFLGSPDQNGNVKTLNLSGFNPFQATGDLFSLAGLMSNTNPIVGTVAETLGLDPITNTTDLYPNVSYNPETGRLEAQQGNFAANLLSNTLPLSNLVGNLLPTNQNFKQLLQTNPSAASRQLLSSAGLPTLFQSRNIPQEIIKAETARVTAQNNVKSAAMASGDYSEASQYPALNAWMQQLTTLQASGKLTKYSPVQPTQVANPATALLSTFTGSTPSASVAYNNQILQLSNNG